MIVNGSRCRRRFEPRRVGESRVFSEDTHQKWTVASVHDIRHLPSGPRRFISIFREDTHVAANRALPITDREIRHSGRLEELENLVSYSSVTIHSVCASVGKTYEELSSGSNAGKMFETAIAHAAKGSIKSCIVDWVIKLIQSFVDLK